MFFPASDWILAFVLTVALEVPVVLFVLRRVEPDLLRLAVLVAFANLATHPVVWYVISQLFLVGTPAFVIVAETWAIAAEALFFLAAIRGLALRQAVIVALAANVVSFLAGRLIGVLLPDFVR
jgi:hypothetical protein